MTTLYTLCFMAMFAISVNYTTHIFFNMVFKAIKFANPNDPFNEVTWNGAVLQLTGSYTSTVMFFLLMIGVI